MRRVVREITKTYEETIRGTLAQLAERFARDQALGEIVLIVEGAAEKDIAAASPAAGLRVEDLIAAGLSLKQASALIAKLPAKVAARSTRPHSSIVAKPSRFDWLGG